MVINGTRVQLAPYYLSVVTAAAKDIATSCGKSLKYDSRHSYSNHVDLATCHGCLRLTDSLARKLCNQRQTSRWYSTYEPHPLDMPLSYPYIKLASFCDAPSFISTFLTHFFCCDKPDTYILNLHIYEHADYRQLMVLFKSTAAAWALQHHHPTFMRLENFHNGPTLEKIRPFSLPIL